MKHRLLIVSITALSFFVFQANAQNNPSKAKTPKINTKKVNTPAQAAKPAPAKSKAPAKATSVTKKDAKMATSPCEVSKTPAVKRTTGSNCTATKMAPKQSPCSMRMKPTQTRNCSCM
ncbi:MAG: hypothetical protein H7A23_05715 [Leptospiraceae bacterium]|nr:hypothetical protein [Leptospiraceae bacterium]MCP5494035.1 hypothetical protein [Leptospiraceae bacterium]